MEISREVELRFAKDSMLQMIRESLGSQWGGGSTREMGGNDDDDDDDDDDGEDIVYLLSSSPARNGNCETSKCIAKSYATVGCWHVYFSRCKDIKPGCHEVFLCDFFRMFFKKYTHEMSIHIYIHIYLIHRDFYQNQS